VAIRRGGQQRELEGIPKDTDPEGRFVRRIEIRGEGAFKDDGIYLHGDRHFILRGPRLALASGRGLASAEDEKAEPMSLEVYCPVPAGG
jgi:hypothetical protein